MIFKFNSSRRKTLNFSHSIQFLGWNKVELPCFLLVVLGDGNVVVSVGPEEPVEVEVAVDDGEHVAVEQNLLGDHQLVLVLVEVHLVWVQTTLKENQ